MWINISVNLIGILYMELVELPKNIRLPSFRIKSMHIHYTSSTQSNMCIKQFLLILNIAINIII